MKAMTIIGTGVTKKSIRDEDEDDNGDYKAFIV